MNIICRAVGHVTSGEHPRCPGEEYMEIDYFCVDGVGRKHAIIHAECQRCGDRFKVGMVHISNSILNKR